MNETAWRCAHGRRPALGAFSAARLVIFACWPAVVLAAAASGGEPGPIVETPAAGAPLILAAPLPADAPSAALLRLVDIDRPATIISAQRAPAIADEGTADARASRLLAVIPPRADAQTPRAFRLEQGPAEKPGSLRFEDLDDKSLKIWDGDAPVLVYNHGLIVNENVPASDHRRSRACYVHPLWGLQGEVLTDDFPRDHYHHHGVFWTWPHVRIEQEEHDLWAGSTIRDEFVCWLHREAGPTAAVLAVENGWFVGDRKVMIERVWMRAFAASDGQRAVDFEFVWIPQERSVTLWGAEGKSYGGLTMRFAPREGRPVITTPDGRTKDDLRETPLPWADFTAKFLDAHAPSGAAVFVDPNHPDYPPTWLTRHYGCLCVGWPGVQSRTFEPGQPIRLSYRIWIHEAEQETADIQRAYEAYAAGAQIKWR